MHFPKSTHSPICSLLKSTSLIHSPRLSPFLLSRLRRSRRSRAALAAPGGSGGSTTWAAQSIGKPWESRRKMVVKWKLMGFTLWLCQSSSIAFEHYDRISGLWKWWFSIAMENYQRVSFGRGICVWRMATCMIWLVLYLPLPKIWKSVQMMRPNWMEKTCSKPPTSHEWFLASFGLSVAYSSMEHVCPCGSLQGILYEWNWGLHEQHTDTHTHTHDQIYQIESTFFSREFLKMDQINMWRNSSDSSEGNEDAATDWIITGVEPTRKEQNSEDLQQLTSKYTCMYIDWPTAKTCTYEHVDDDNGGDWCNQCLGSSMMF